MRPWRLRAIHLVFFPGLLLCTGTRALGSAELTLAEALAIAQERSPELATTRSRREQRVLERKSAWAKLLPSADFGVSSAWVGESPSSGSGPWKRALELTLSETLWDNGETVTQGRIATRDLEISELETARARDRLALDVFLQFAELSLGKALDGVREEQERLLARQLALMERQYHQGMKTREDLLRLRAQHRRAEIERLGSRAFLAKTTLSITRLLATDEGARFRVLEARRVGKLDGADWKAGLESSWESRLAGLKRTGLDLEEALVTRKRWPELTISSSVGYANTDRYATPGGLGSGFGSTGSWSWDVKVGLTYNLWDWGIRRRDALVAAEKRKQVDLRIDIDLLDLRAEASKLRVELGRLSEQHQQNFLLLQMDEESYSLLESEFKRGAVSYLNYITALADLSDARGRYYASYFGLLQALAKRSYLEGRAYEFTLEQK